MWNNVKEFFTNFQTFAQGISTGFRVVLIIGVIVLAIVAFYYIRIVLKAIWRVLVIMWTFIKNLFTGHKQRSGGTSNNKSTSTKITAKKAQKPKKTKTKTKKSSNKKRSKKK